jgi:hypothetical protein
VSIRAAAILLCLLLAGCGVTLPSSTAAGPSTAVRPAATSPTQTQRPAAGARPAPTAATHRPLHQPDPYDSPLAAEVLVAFASQYINWNFRTVAADMRLLASESVGQAHAAMELAAGETARDYELQRGGIANSGVVEGASPLTGPGGKWVIVTRERTTATASTAYQGLAPAWHVIVARAIELSPGHWAVSLWQPES